MHGRQNWPLIVYYYDLFYRHGSLFNPCRLLIFQFKVKKIIAVMAKKKFCHVTLCIELVAPFSNEFRMPFYISIVRVMVFNATFNNISVIYRDGQFYWWRKPGETHRQCLDTKVQDSSVVKQNSNMRISK